MQLCKFEGLKITRNENSERVGIVSHAAVCDIDDSCEKVKFRTRTKGCDA